jgi:hypothetical protein
MTAIAWPYSERPVAISWRNWVVIRVRATSSSLNWTSIPSRIWRVLSGCELEIAARGAMGDDGEEGIGVERRRSGRGLPYIPWWRWTGQSRNLLQRVAYSPLHQAKYPVGFVCNLPCYRRFADSLGESRTSPAKTRRSSLSVPTWCTDPARLRVTNPGRRRRPCAPARRWRSGTRRPNKHKPSTLPLKRHRHQTPYPTSQDGALPDVSQSKSARS